MEASSDPLLYRPLRVVGMVTDRIPFVMNRLGDHTFVTVVIGQCFHVYNLDKLAVCMVSKPAHEAISHIQVYNHYTFAAVGREILCYYRAKIVQTLTHHRAPVAGLLAVGHLLLSFDSDNHVFVYDAKDKAVSSDFRILRESAVSVACHPSTYVNKAAFGFADGALELWNLRSKKLLHTFRCTSKFTSAVCSMEQSPAADVLAVGFASGDLLLLNLRMDMALFHFRQQGAVTSLSFRSDVLVDDAPFLASSSAAGAISFWQITPQGVQQQEAEGRSRGRLISTLPAHQGAVRKVAFAAGEPLLLSAGDDNSLRAWLFDLNSGGTACRLLRSRTGFASHPLRIRCFAYGAANGNSDYEVGEEVLCAESNGVLRGARTTTPHLLQEYSSKEVRLPECVDLSLSATAHPWGTLLSIHRNCSSAYTWSLSAHSLGSVVLKRSDADHRKDRSSSAHPRAATAVCVTACGHFGVVGYADGRSAKFSMQSGILRGNFPKDTSSEVHSGAVSGVAVDLRNLTMVTAGTDGRVVFWHFLAQTVLATHCFASPLTLLRSMDEAGLVAVGDSSSCIRLFDMATQRLCRVLPAGHALPLTDMAFSSDCRRLLSSSADGTIRVWEVATARCLNFVSLPCAVRAIAVSRNGDLLIAEDGLRGVRICYDASLTQAVHLWREPLRPSPLLGNPSPSPSTEPLSEHSSGHEEALALVAKHSALLRGCEPAISTSDLPKLLWATLLRSRGPRAEAELKMPVVRPSVPFLLQAAGDLRGNIVFSNSAGPAPPAPPGGSRLLGKSKKARPAALAAHTGKLALLITSSGVSAEEQARACDELVHLLRHTPPQVCEGLIRDLVRHAEDLSGHRLLQRFLVLLAALVAQGKAFELVQAYVHITLQTHGEAISASFSLRKEVDGLQAALFTRGEEMRGHVSAALCYIKALLGVPLM